MPLYCVPLFIALVGPYYMYHIRTILALNYTLDSKNLLVLGMHLWTENQQFVRDR